MLSTRKVNRPLAGATAAVLTAGRRGGGGTGGGSLLRPRLASGPTAGFEWGRRSKGGPFAPFLTFVKRFHAWQCFDAQSKSRQALRPAQPTFLELVHLSQISDEGAMSPSSLFSHWISKEEVPWNYVC